MPEISGFSYPERRPRLVEPDDRDVSVHHGLRGRRLHRHVALPPVRTHRVQAGGAARDGDLVRLPARRLDAAAAAPRPPRARHPHHRSRRTSPRPWPGSASCTAATCSSWCSRSGSCWRHEIVARAGAPAGLKRTFYPVLALGTYDTSPQALEIDHRAITLLAGIGLPGACMLHGYVGFIFGAIKANPWWSTPLMPVIFLMSAAVSGIALLIGALPGRVQAARPRRPTSPASRRWRAGCGSSSSSPSRSSCSRSS